MPPAAHDPASAAAPPAPLQRELLVSLGLHLAAMAIGALLPVFGCADGCGEGTRAWTFVGGVALFAGAATAAGTELARSLAATGDGWIRWTALLAIAGALVAATLAFLTRPAPTAQEAPLERGIALVLLAAASNAVLAAAGAAIARFGRRRPAR